MPEGWSWEESLILPLPGSEPRQLTYCPPALTWPGDDEPMDSAQTDRYDACSYSDAE
jgi:hypothetical protein